MEIISEKNSNPLITMRRRLKKIPAFTKEFQERKPLGCVVAED